MNFIQFATECRKFLELKKVFEIRIKSKSHSWAAGFCEQHTRKGVIIKHVITLYIPQIEKSEFDLYAVIAHEFIHAWQAETLKDYQYHGLEFQAKAREITDYFRVDWHIKLIDVFSPATDID